MYEVVWPRGKSFQVGQYAKRFQTMEGKRIGFLWDNLFRGDEIFSVLERELTERHPNSTVFSWDVFGNTHGGDEHQVLEGLPEKFEELQIDAVVSGIGA